MKHFTQPQKYFYTLLLFVSLLFIVSATAAQAQNSPEVFSFTAAPGSDITASFQKAIDDARAAGGGAVQLPAGNYTLSGTVELAGTFKRFPHGGANIMLRGGPTRITYSGPPNHTMIDMEAPNNSSISNITLDGDNIPGTVGIRYRAGYERGVNGGKANVFSNISIARVDVGMWIGDPFAPDLVGSGFYSLRIEYCRICLLVEGANVAGMTFYNPIISSYTEAGIKLMGETARLIRHAAGDPHPPEEVPGSASVLTDIQNGQEIFEKDVPEYALKNRAFKKSYNGKEYYWAPGGAPEIAVYNAIFGGHAANSWAIDSNFGNIRLYTARVEGPQGFFRRTSNMPATRFTDVFTDVNVTSYGGTSGNVMEYNGAGPFYLYGGSFAGHVALGNNTKVYMTGTRFEHGKFAYYPALLPHDFQLPPNSRVHRTGKQEMFPGRLGMYDNARIDPVAVPGFVQLPNTRGAKVHSVDNVLSGTQKAPAGKTTLTITMHPPLLNADYQVSLTPNFDAGNFWISDKTAQSFVAHFKNPAPANAEVDWIIRNNAVAAQ